MQSSNQRIAELEDMVGCRDIEIERLGDRIAELEARYDLEHEAYMDLFHQLSEYERKELERNA